MKIVKIVLFMSVYIILNSFTPVLSQCLNDIERSSNSTEELLHETISNKKKFHYKSNNNVYTINFNNENSLIYSVIDKNGDNLYQGSDLDELIGNVSKSIEQDGSNVGFIKLENFSEDKKNAFQVSLKIKDNNKRKLLILNNIKDDYLEKNVEICRVNKIKLDEIKLSDNGLFEAKQEYLIGESSFFINVQAKSKEIIQLFLDFLMALIYENKRSLASEKLSPIEIITKTEMALKKHYPDKTDELHIILEDSINRFQISNRKVLNGANNI